MKKPRILLCTREIPFPQHRSGGTVIVYPILKYLGKDYDIDIIFPEYDSESVNDSDLNQLRKYCNNISIFPFKKNIIRTILIILFHPLPLLFCVYSKNYFRKNIRPLIKSADYQAILVQDSSLARFVPDMDLPKSTRKIFIASDYYTILYRRMATHSRNPLLGLYNFITYLKLRRNEPFIHSIFDASMFVSRIDSGLFASDHPEVMTERFVIPNGIDLSDFRERASTGDESMNSIIFTGNMAYEPNRQAVMWFYRNVFGILKDEIAGITWTIAGKNCTRYIRITDHQVIIHESVPSLLPYIHKAKIVISPLLSGAGLKNKVIEAMASRRIVIGSNLSFDGIPVENHHSGIIASTPDEYVKYIKYYINNTEQRTTVENNAFSIIEDQFDLQRTIDKWRRIIADE